MEKDRQQCWNKLKKEKSPERTVEIKVKAKGITRQIKPLRKELKTAKKALERAEYFKRLLSVEHKIEHELLSREMNREQSRNKDRDWDR